MRGTTARLEQLRAVPLFGGLSKRELRTILNEAREIEFPAGFSIVTEGSKASDLYVILEGEAVVTMGGRRRRTLGPGAYFGEMSVLDGGPRTATVTASTLVATLRLPSKTLHALLAADGGMARKILADLARRFRESRPRADELGHG